MKRLLPLILILPLLSAGGTQGVKLPPYEREVLPNGAVIITVRKPNVPLITLRALVLGGSEADPAGKAGLASLTAELLRRGTVKRNAEQFALDLEALGASINAGSDRQMSFLATEFLTRESEKATELFGEALLQPAFTEDEFTKARAQYIDRARAGKDNLNMAVAQYFASMLYPSGHPYNRPQNGDETSLSTITRDDIIAFYKRQYTARNLVLIAAGDFDPTEMKATLTRMVAPLRAGELWKAPLPKTPKFAQSRLLLIDKPDATQTYFVIGWPGIDRKNPDRVTLGLVNTLFGGRFTSMLNEALRVNSGLTYGAGSRIEMNRFPGAIYISTYTKTETTEKAVDMALTVLKKLSDAGITQDQLDSARNYIKGMYPTSELETADQVAGLLGQIEVFGLDRSEVDSYFQKLDALTLDGVNAIIKRYYSDANLQFSLLGNASKVEAVSKKYAPSMTVIPLTGAGVSAPPF